MPLISSTPPRITRADAERLPGWLVIVSLLVPPILFMSASRGNWLFDLGGADNWQYVKYFQAWNNGDHALRTLMDINYKGSRVPWIVWGYLAHLLLGADLGTIVLQSTILILSASCLYLIVEMFFSAKIALIIAIFAVSFPGFQASGVPGFWNYHGAIANLYFLAGLYFLARACAGKRNIIDATLSGACLFAALLTTFIFAVLLPVLIGFAFTCWRRFGPQPFLRLLAFACMGALMVTLAFAIASYMTGGQFWFFLTQLAFANKAAHDNLWVQPLDVWLPRASWLAPTLTTALASLVFLPTTITGRTPDLWFARAFVVQFWLAQLALIVCDLFGQNAFQVAYIQYVTMPSTFLALAGMAAVTFKASVARISPPVLSAVAILVVVPAQVLTGPMLRQTLSGQSAYAFAVPTLAGIAVLAAAGWLRHLRIGPWLALAGFTLVAMLAYERRPYAVTERCYVARSMFPAIAEGSTFISSLRVVQSNGALWYDAGDRIAWAAGCLPIPLQQIAFPLMHAGLVRPLGTEDRLPLDAIRKAEPARLEAFFIVSAEESAARLAGDFAALSGTDGPYQALVPKSLTVGSGTVVVQAYRRRH